MRQSFHLLKVKQANRWKVNWCSNFSNKWRLERKGDPFEELKLEISLEKPNS